MGTQQAKGEGTPNKSTLQSYIQNFTKEAVDGIVEIMRHGRNENLKFGAYKLIIDKSIPDIKSVEVGGMIGEDGKRQPIQLFVDVGRGFIPATIQLPPTSIAGNAGGQPPVQNAGMAPAGKENNNSDIRSNKAGTPTDGSVLASVPDKGGG